MLFILNPIIKWLNSNLSLKVDIYKRIKQTCSLQLLLFPIKTSQNVFGVTTWTRQRCLKFHRRLRHSCAEKNIIFTIIHVQGVNSDSQKHTKYETKPQK